MMRFLYLGFAIFSLLIFASLELKGVTLNKPETAKNVNLAQPNTVRNNPGSHRRSHYHAVFIHHK